MSLLLIVVIVLELQRLLSVRVVGKVNYNILRLFFKVEKCLIELAVVLNHLTFSLFKHEGKKLKLRHRSLK